MTMMHAKLQVGMVTENMGYSEPKEKTSETLHTHAVAASKYPEDGSDDDNTYAKWSPGAKFVINIVNPALWGEFKHGDKYYVDFTKADA